MPAKPNTRNWGDVQIAIATGAVVLTLGLWNLFAQPEKTILTQAAEPENTPPPAEPPVALEPAEAPQIKIIFTQTAPQNVVITQQQSPKKNNNNNNGGGGGAPVTQTKSS